MGMAGEGGGLGGYISFVVAQCAYLDGGLGCMKEGSEFGGIS